jgi:hypothetical protein
MTPLTQHCELAALRTGPMREKAACQARRNHNESGLLAAETLDFVHSGVILEAGEPQLSALTPEKSP